MSLATRCNFCTLKQLKAQAARDGEVVIVAGTLVFIGPPGQECDPRNPAASFGSLTTHCVC